MKQEFIIALTEHRVLGYILAPYLIRKVEDRSFYTINKLVREHDINSLDYDFSSEERKIIHYIENYSDERLSKKFSPKKGLQNFFQDIDDTYFHTTITPYIEQQIFQAIQLIGANNIRLFLKASKYINLYDEDLIQIMSTEGTATFNFQRFFDGIRYNLQLFHNSKEINFKQKKVIMLTNSPCTLVSNGKLYTFSKLKGKNLFPFLTKPFITIPKNVEDKYFRTFVLNTIRDHQVTAQGFSIEETVPRKKTFLTINTVDGYPALQLKFRYGNREFNACEQSDDSVYLQVIQDDYRFFKFKKDLKWEKTTIEWLEERGMTCGEHTLCPKSSEKLPPEELYYRSMDWLNEHREALEQNDIHISHRTTERKYFVGEQKLTLEVKSIDDWFDIYAKVQFGEFFIPFIRLKKHILAGIREFELPNGEIAILPEEWFKRYKDLLPFSEELGETLRFQKHHFNLLQDNLTGIDKKYKEKFEQLSKENAKVEAEVPAGINASLRNYQAEGFSWMYQLRNNNFGGCLADDMGLGKTIQTLTLLQKVSSPRAELVSSDSNGSTLFAEEAQQEIQPASLVIVPTSLVHNWNNEIAKFTPELKCYKHVGINRKKALNIDALINGYDIILTTYGTIRNDYQLFENHTFHYIILDESQYIKNPTSKIYQAVIRLQSNHRLVLTGTPIENSLSDLWSQVNFLNKDLLGSLAFFKREFIVPIEKKNDEEKQQQLQSLIHPFILRRTKEEVAKDLPPITHQTRHCVMTPDQKSKYEEEKSQIRNSILQNIESHGIQKSALLVLQGLTKLRQLANHPMMIDAETNMDSGKFNEIIRAMSNLMAENHKVLVFSSFVKHLEILENAFQKKKWKTAILTGQTRDREEAVRDFQENDDTRIFLISLKAGGVGLNLISADYVFIVDPWWNPAAENQAINRAHRIGQDKKVFVYRFISKDTIEEKIQVLKEKKSQLSEKFINSNNPFNAIDKDELIGLFE
ncbi:DEAD/DEAH box helicase [Puteibacter caeruleilacunae]|nr:DEAD/DEAH box helicase [Puteibacter caeruleilacunae]